MYQFFSPEILNLVREVESLRDIAYHIKDKLKNDFPKWDFVKDARITTFSKFINVSNSTQLSLTFVGHHLLDPEWWIKTAKKDLPVSDKNIYVNEYHSISKIAFVQFIFSSIESGLRLILKAVDPNACNNGTAEFKSIYDCILNTKLINKPPNSIELLDLLRLVRNTIHNNGVYFHRNGNNQSVTYKGKQYDFVIEQAIDFVTWEFLIQISKDLLELMNSIIRDETVKNISSTIRDPFAK